MYIDIKKQREIIVVFIVILAIGIWRTNVPEMREFITGLFRAGTIILFSLILWKTTNKWAALFLLSTLIPQFYLCRHLNIIDINGQMYFPEIDAIITTMNVVFGLLWYFCIISLDNTETVDDWILLAICIVAVINVFVLLYQYHLKIKPFGLTTNPNEVSALLALSFPAFLNRDRWRGIVLLIIGFILCKSSGGFISMLVGVAFYALLTISGTWIFFFIPGLIALGILYISFIDMPTISHRWEVWKHILIRFKQSWLFGYEYGSLKWTTMQDKVFRYINSNGRLWWYTANNEFVHLLFEKGVFFILVLCGYLINIVKRVKKHKPIIPLVALMIIITNSCFTYIFHNGVNAMLGLTWLGLLERQIRREEEHEKVFI